MEQKTKQKMSTKKKASAVVAGVLVAALALGGAYAWTDYSQNARNTFKGNVAADVLLHDDFNGENKDVYVENTGDSEVFVRVKFAEYLQIGNNSVLTAYSEEGATDKKADPNDVTTWPVHQFHNAVAENNKCNLSAHSYFEWNMTGAQKAYLAGVTESNSDGYGGLSKEAFDTLTVDADVTLGDIITQKKNTLPASNVMMLSEWLELVEAIEKGETEEQLPSACWLLDTDGWAYWSEALQPGTATNLLLDSVVATDVAPHDNWVYHIDVQLQAATITEMEAWYREGMKDVANPDNSIATVTQNGLSFIQYRAGDYIGGADGTIMGVDGERYKSVANNVYINIKEENEENPTYVLAGQDGKIGNDDDNMLAGRSAANDGGIEVENINIETMTYTIKGADADYVVTVGIDKKLGTYDDVITSESGALGKYLIDKDDVADKVGWNYLGGELTNMLVATEYVLDNVIFSASSSAAAYVESKAQEKIVDIGTNMGITAKVNPVELKMSAEQHTGNQVNVCTKGCAEGAHSGCTHGFSSYYTETDPQGDITDTTFFALSLKEVLDAYGDSTKAAVRELRRVQAAPAYVHETPGQGGNNFNYNNSTSWKDGAGNAITTTNYWLRSPGYCVGRASIIRSSGEADATFYISDTYVGVRPACYLDLTSSN